MSLKVAAASPAQLADDRELLTTHAQSPLRRRVEAVVTADEAARFERSLPVPRLDIEMDSPLTSSVQRQASIAMLEGYLRDHLLDAPRLSALLLMMTASTSACVVAAGSPSSSSSRAYASTVQMRNASGSPDCEVVAALAWA